jgi:hypothetical protein
MPRLSRAQYVGRQPILSLKRNDPTTDAPMSGSAEVQCGSRAFRDQELRPTFRTIPMCGRYRLLKAQCDRQSQSKTNR